MSEEPKKIIRVRDVMTSELHYIDGMATAGEAAEMMRIKKSDALLVSKRNSNDATGIVVVQDIIKKVVLPEQSPRNVNVYEIMTKPVIALPADMDVRYAVRLMTRADIRRAPVEEKGAYIGILSFANLILGGFVV